MRDPKSPRAIAALAIALPAAAAWAIALPGPAVAAEEWETILEQALQSERSQTRHEGLKQVDTTKAKGLKAIWNVLASPQPYLVDWYVREGAYEALLGAEGPEAEKEIERVLASSGNPLAKEAIVYAVVWKIRSEVVKAYGGRDDRKIEEAKYLLRKKRGVEYFEYVLPVIRKIDPEKKYLKRIQGALKDRHPRVQRAALTALVAYPDASNIPLLLENLKRLEKQKAAAYREWVLTRYALETLTGQYYRENVSDWLRWWDVAKGGFSIDKRVEEEGEKGEAGAGKTVVVRREGVEVILNMKVAGPPGGYPLLVLPWHGYEVDYFRPYFHGVEEFLRVYYVRMPQIDDYKGLARHTESNLVVYPTALLAKALIDLMKESGLEKFGVLGHGPDACVLCMMLAAEHPDKVTHMVLINPRSSGDAYSGAIENVRREGARLGLQEVVKGADSITLMPDGNLKYKPADPGEAGGLGRALYNLAFADPSEPEAGALRYLYDLPGGTHTLNDRSWSAKAIVGAGKLTLPVLIFAGERCPFTPVGDMNQVAALFRNCEVVRLKDASQTPFISHPYLFTKQLEKLFKGAKVRAKAPQS